MINKKNLFTILVFLLITIIVLLQTFSVRKFENTEENFIEKEAVEKTYFKNISYYTIKDEKENSELFSKDLEITTISGVSSMKFMHVKGRQKTNSSWLDWVANAAQYNGNSQDLNLSGDVKLTNEKAQYKAEDIYYNFKKEFLESKGEVTSRVIDLKTEDMIKIKSNYMSSWVNEKRVLFIGNVDGELERKLKYQTGMKFNAEKLEYFQNLSEMHLEKNVKINRNNYHLESQKADIFLENFNKKLKYYVLYDDIKLEEILHLPSGEQSTRRAFSEKLEGFISESKTVLSGAPRVEQGEDVIKGYQITLRENVEIVEVDDSQSSFRLKKDN